MKIYHLQAGQYGDSIISLRVAEELKKQYPDAKIYGGVSQKYSSILPLLKTASYLDEVFEWTGYCSYSDKDKYLLDRMNFNLFYCPFQPSTPNFWQTHHQTADAFLRHGLTPPEDLKINLPSLSQGVRHNNEGGWRSAVCISLFANWGQGCKSLSIDKVQKIVDYLVSKKYDVVQLDGNHIQLSNIYYKTKNWLDTAEHLSYCNLHIGTDSAANWLSSCYSTPNIGLYALNYYAGSTSSKNWQAINPNGIALEAPNANDIPLDEIIAAIDKKLLA